MRRPCGYWRAANSSALRRGLGWPFLQGKADGMWPPLRQWAGERQECAAIGKEAVYMILSTPARMRELDDAAIRDYGIPGLLLMENAAYGISEYIAQLFRRGLGCAHGEAAGISRVCHIAGSCLSAGSGSGADVCLPIGASPAAAGPVAGSRLTAGACLPVCASPAAAGSSMAAPSRAAYGAPAACPKPCVLFVCGKGNNGGDGFAAARMLFLKGFRVAVAVLAQKSDVAGDAAINLGICEKLGVAVAYASEENARDVIPTRLAAAALVVDGIFGTGFRGKPDGVCKYAIDAINESEKPVLSIDVPSGLDSLTGAASGACVNADATIALGLLKIGLATGPDAGKAGRVFLRDIGLPKGAADKFAWDTWLATGAAVSRLLPRRPPGAHKGDFGRVMAITGSPGMTGAGKLTAAAALRAGAGLVYLAVPSALANIYEAGISEAITLPVGAEGDRRLTADSAKELIEIAERMSVVSIGPGLSTNPDTLKSIKRVISGAQKPLVIDADALTAVSTDISVLSRIRGGAVLTPHVGEMARLLGTEPEKVSADRLGAARGFAIKWGVTLVLKGFRTVVATPDGRAFINPTGNAGMATAGSGDVLTGIVAAFIGCGMALGDAALAAAYVHGLAGDCAAAELGEMSLTSGDLISHLPKAAAILMQPYP
jgi:NAD(P)H-hydrate epimerase